MGITDLDISFTGDAPIDWLSGSVISGMGLRHHAARDSSDKGAWRGNEC